MTSSSTGVHSLTDMALYDDSLLPHTFLQSD